MQGVSQLDSISRLLRHQAFEMYWNPVKYFSQLRRGFKRKDSAF